MKTNTPLNLYYFITLCATLLVSNGLYGASKQNGQPDPSISTSSKDAANGLTQFKKFISSPPTVANLIAEVSEPAGTNQEMSSIYVLIRCQTNGFFYREAPTMLGLLSTNIFPEYRLAGCYDNIYWSYSTDGTTTTLQYFTNQNASMVATLDYVKMWASKFTHLGIEGVLPNRIVWNGNSLMRVTNFLGVPISGEVVVASNGLPLGMDLILEPDGNKIPWEIKYKFLDSKIMPSFIPSVISVFALRNGVKIFLKEINIKDIELSEKPLLGQDYMPDSFRQKGLILIDEKALNPAKVPADPTGGNKHLILIGFILLNVVFAVFFFNWKRCANNKNN